MNVTAKINYTDEPQPQVKLADFDISKILKNDKDNFTNTSVTNPNGTKGWMAPEVYQFERFDFKVDIFALGCIFGYTLSEGKHPFGDDVIKRIDRIREKKAMVLVREDLKDPYSLDDVALGLVKSMLEVEPIKRPTVELVVKDYFLIFDMVILAVNALVL